MRVKCAATLAVSCCLATTTEARAAEFVARVTSVVFWELSTEQWADLRPADLDSLRQSGIVVNATQRTLTSPELGLAGHWLAFRQGGPRRYHTDTDGYVRVPTVPPDLTQVKVFEQVRDTTPVGTIERITFVPEGQTPVTTVLRLPYSPPVKMNPREELAPIASLQPATPFAWSRAGVRSSVRALLLPPPGGAACQKRRRCPAGANRAPGCCLDYDGVAGDGEPYLRSGNCGAKGYWNFLLSTCFRWTFLKKGRPCLLERAVLRVAGRNCWNQHKFRNCQNMDETDFDVTPATATIDYDEETTFAVRNNTPANSTCFAFTARPQRAGVLKRADTTLRASSQCGDYELDHFDSSKHRESAQVKFKSPKKPPKLKCSETYRVASTAFGMTKPLTIEVRRERCGFTFTNLKVAGYCDVPAGRIPSLWTYSGRVCGDPLENEWDLTARFQGGPVDKTFPPVRVRFSEAGERIPANSGGYTTLSLVAGDSPRIKIDHRHTVIPAGCVDSVGTAPIESDDTCPES